MLLWHQGRQDINNYRIHYCSLWNCWQDTGNTNMLKGQTIRTDLNVNPHKQATLSVVNVVVGWRETNLWSTVSCACAWRDVIARSALMMFRRDVVYRLIVLLQESTRCDSREERQCESRGRSTTTDRQLACDISVVWFWVVWFLFHSYILLYLQERMLNSKFSIRSCKYSSI